MADKLAEEQLTITATASRALLERAKKVAPGGIQGDGRWTDPFPLFFEKAQGARIWDVDGNEYIDYWASAGPSILGHNDLRVREAVVDALNTEGVLFTTPHPREVELAEVFAELVPCAEKTSFCGGGASDAMYNAVRVARAFTGRRKLLKFEGGYHGWHDDVAVSVRPSLADAGPRDAPLPVAVSAGALAEVTSAVRVASFHDRMAVERAFAEDGDDLAAVIIEPVSHSLGCLVIEREFLAFLREICDAHGTLLIFDEVITGFRHHIGGVQALYEITPDIGVFGKAMANGFTISALAGSNAVMSMFMPDGPVFISGTYMGNLLGVTASLATINLLRDGEVHQKLWRQGDRISTEVNATIEELGLNAHCASFGGFWSLYFTSSVRDYRDLVAAETYNKDQAFRLALLSNGIYVHGGHAGSTRPSRAFISAAHTDEDIETTIAVVNDFLFRRQADLK